MYMTTGFSPRLPPLPRTGTVWPGPHYGCPDGSVPARLDCTGKAGWRQRWRWRRRVAGRGENVTPLVLSLVPVGRVSLHERSHRMDGRELVIDNFSSSLGCLLSWFSYTAAIYLDLDYLKKKTLIWVKKRGGVIGGNTFAQSSVNTVCLFITFQKYFVIAFLILLSYFSFVN